MLASEKTVLEEAITFEFHIEIIQIIFFSTFKLNGYVLTHVAFFTKITANAMTSDTKIKKINFHRTLKILVELNN